MEKKDFLKSATLCSAMALHLLKCCIVTDAYLAIGSATLRLVSL